MLREKSKSWLSDCRRRSIGTNYHSELMGLMAHQDLRVHSLPAMQNDLRGLP